MTARDQFDALRKLEDEMRGMLRVDPAVATWVDDWRMKGWIRQLQQIRSALLSTEDVPPNDPGTLTVTYGARSFTVSHVSRATYDAVCTVLHGREIQDPRPPGETDTP